MRKLMKNSIVAVVLSIIAAPSFAQESPAFVDTASSAFQDVLAFVQENAFFVGGVSILLIAALALRVLVGGRGGRAPDVLAVHSLVAMSQVAIADGRIGDQEVSNIAQILTRLTGTPYAPEQVMEMLERLNPSADDLAQVGQDLSDKDRQIVLEAALNIAVADGDIQPNEYAVVSDLAQRMSIGADQFRSAMDRISAHIKTIQPA